jgi:hypothetical protein
MRTDDLILPLAVDRRPLPSVIRGVLASFRTALQAASVLLRLGGGLWADLDASLADPVAVLTRPCSSSPATAWPFS